MIFESWYHSFLQNTGMCRALYKRHLLQATSSCCDPNKLHSPVWNWTLCRINYIVPFQKAFTVEILPLEIVGMIKFAQETDLCMQRKMICFFKKNQRLIEPYFIICETSFTGFSIQNLLSRLFEGDDMVLGKQDQKVWLEMTTNITDSQTTRDKLFLKYTKVVRLNK